MSLTVPTDMIVAATGTLRIRTRFSPPPSARAWRGPEPATRRSSSAGKDEIGDPASRPPTQYPTLTWHFTADSVRDFAWAAARHFIWDAAG